MVIMARQSAISCYSDSITGLAVSPDCADVVVAGRSVFKIYSCYRDEEDFGLGDDELIARRCLRESSRLRPNHRVNLNYSSTDVAWSWSQRDRLATSASNGAVVIWNLSSSPNKMMERVFTDHTRTAHKVHFSPVDPHLLASCSQDSTVRIYDVRMAEAVMSIGNQNAGASVRDVQFNPLEQPILAGGYENGHLHIWDMRKSDRRELGFPAHNESLLAIDWHPELRHWIATAGRDKCVKTWLATDARSVKQPDTVVPATAAVSAVRWRPAFKSQLGSGCMHMDFSINVTDIRRPFVPQATFDDQRGPTVGMAWRDRSGRELISSGKDGRLYLHFYSLAARPADSAPPMALGININGGVTLAQRAKHRPKGVHVSAIEKHMSYIPVAPPPPPPPNAAAATAQPSLSNLAPVTANPDHSHSHHSSMVAHSYSIVPHLHHHHQQHHANVASSYHQRHSSISAAVPGGVEVAQHVQHKQTSSDKPEDRLLVAPASQLSYFHISDESQDPVDGAAEAATDMDWFKYCAEHYKLKGPPLGELCSLNASVSDKLGRPEVTIAWRNFKTFYAADGDLSDLLGCLPPELQRELLMEAGGNAQQAKATSRQRHHSVRQQQSVLGAAGGHLGEGMNGLATEEGLPVDEDLELAENDLTLTSVDVGSRLIPVNGHLNGATSKSGADRDGGGSDDDMEMLVHEQGGGGVVTKSNAGHFDQRERADGSSVITREVLDQTHVLKDATDHDRATAEQFLASVKPSNAPGANGDGLDQSSPFAHDVDGFLLQLGSGALDADDGLSLQPWDPKQTVRQTLLQFAETGDVQSAVSMYLVLGHDRLRGLLDSSVVESWFLTYINLLHRNRLFNESVKIIQMCPFREVRALHKQESTMFFTNCSQCSKAMDGGEGGGPTGGGGGGGWFCQRCKAIVSRCCVCHRRARGILMWCQGCSHGGHLTCMRAWHRRQRRDTRGRCPAGCNHICQYR